MGVLGDVKADNGVDDGLHRCEGVFGVLSEDEGIGYRCAVEWLERVDCVDDTRADD